MLNEIREGRVIAQKSYDNSRMRRSTLINLARSFHRPQCNRDLLVEQLKESIKAGWIDEILTAAEAEPSTIIPLLGQLLPSIEDYQVHQRFEKMISVDNSHLGEIALVSLDHLIRQLSQKSSHATLSLLRLRRIERLMYLGRIHEAESDLVKFDRTLVTTPTESWLLAAIDGNLAELAKKQRQIERAILLSSSSVRVFRQLYSSNLPAGAEAFAGALITHANCLLEKGRTDEVVPLLQEAKLVMGDIVNDVRGKELIVACVEACVEVLLQSGKRREAGAQLQELCNFASELAADYPDRLMERAIIVLLNASSLFLSELEWVRKAERSLRACSILIAKMPPKWHANSFDGFQCTLGATVLRGLISNRRREWGRTLHICRKAVTDHRTSPWKSTDQALSNMLALQAAAARAALELGRHRESCRRTRLAKRIYSRLKDPDLRTRKNVFMMRSNFAYWLYKTGRNREALSELEGALSEVCDEGVARSLNDSSITDVNYLLTQIRKSLSA